MIPAGPGPTANGRIARSVSYGDGALNCQAAGLSRSYLYWKRSPGVSAPIPGLLLPHIAALMRPTNLLATPITPAQTPAAHPRPPCYDSCIAPPEPAFMSVATASSPSATPTAAETDPETLSWMQGFPRHRTNSSPSITARSAVSPNCAGRGAISASWCRP